MRSPAASITATIAALSIGCAGLMMLGIQPLVLGALLEEHRLGVTQLSAAATAEMLALGLVAGVLGGAAPPRHLRLWGAAGAAIMLAGNLACLAATGTALVLSRGAAGAGGGILLWLAICLITQSANPARLSAIFLGAQSASQATLAALLPLFFMPRAGGNAGFAALAALAAVSAATLPLIPRALPDLPKPDEGTGALTMPGMLGLAGTFLFMSAIVGAWVFVDAFTAQGHIAPAIAHYVVSASLAAQLVGAALAAWLAASLPAGRTLMAACATGVLCTALMLPGTGNTAFLAGALLFGFIWIFTLPFFVPLLIRIDPTRRAAMLLAGAQLLGGSAGPQITGLLIHGDDFRPALYGSAAMFAAAVATVAAALAAARGRSG